MTSTEVDRRSCVYIMVKLLLSPEKKTTMLSARCWPFVASTRQDKLYLWGGEGDTEPETVYIYSVNTEKWMKEFTMGPHPPARPEDGGCCLVGQHLYIFGGSVCGLYSGSLYQLNTNSLTWSELSNCSTGGPVRKDGCRIIPYRDHLIVIGGYFGHQEPDSKQPGSRYEQRCTNELHCYSLSTGKSEAPDWKHILT